MLTGGPIASLSSQKNQQSNDDVKTDVAPYKKGLHEICFRVKFGVAPEVIVKVHDFVKDSQDMYLMNNPAQMVPNPLHRQFLHNESDHALLTCLTCINVHRACMNWRQHWTFARLYSWL